MIPLAVGGKLRQHVIQSVGVDLIQIHALLEELDVLLLHCLLDLACCIGRRILPVEEIPTQSGDKDGGDGDQNFFHHKGLLSWD